MIFDTHAHYDDKRFKKDRDSLLSAMEEHGIGTIVNSAASYYSLTEVLELSHKYDFLYCTMGLHPTEVAGLSSDALSRVEENAKDKKCLAIGEIGLDYHWVKDEDGRKEQKKWFHYQLDIAKRLDMPVVIHSRDACEDTMAILKDAAEEGIICDIHCFSYSPEIAKEYVKMGFYIGIGGVVTFSDAKKLKETVSEIPMSRILLETDCPYLAPEPFRGTRNDSTNLPYVVREIARIKGTTENDVIKVTNQNAKTFYRL